MAKKSKSKHDKKMARRKLMKGLTAPARGGRSAYKKHG